MKAQGGRCKEGRAFSGSRFRPETLTTRNPKPGLKALNFKPSETGLLVDELLKHSHNKDTGKAVKNVLSLSLLWYSILGSLTRTTPVP